MTNNLQLFTGLLLFMLCQGTPAENNYLGSERCGSCHREAYSQWQLSDHSKSMQVASRDSVLGDFNDVSVTFHNIESRFFQKDDSYHVETTGADGNTHEYRISYTFGHFPLQQYLVETDNGHIQALNLAWDSRDRKGNGQRWFHLQPDEVITPASPFFWTRHLQNWNSRCAQCHSTDVKKNYDTDNHAYRTTFTEISVGCEACHGPGGTHLRYATENNFDNGSGLVNAPESLLWKYTDNKSIAQAQGEHSDRHIDMCGGCHSRRSIVAGLDTDKSYFNQYRLTTLSENLYYHDGQIQDEVFVLGSFMQSKMHARGVTCNKCHQAHTGKLILEGNSLCVQCHQGKTYNTRAHHFHEQDSAGARCVECHMPATTYMLVDDRRDHRFGIPEPELSMQFDTPNACNRCHRETSAEWAAGAMDQWYGKQQGGNRYARVNAIARLADPTMTGPILELLAGESLSSISKATLLENLSAFPSRMSIDAAEQYLSHSKPVIRAAAVRHLQSAPPARRWAMLSPLANDPVKIVRLEVARAFSAMSAEIPGEHTDIFTGLIEEYRASLSLSHDSPSTQTELAALELNLGNPLAAEKAFTRALNIEPLFIPALLNFADYYRAINRESDAVPLLEKALEFAPDSGAVNFVYGLSLVRAKKYQRALPFLKTATEQEDSQPRYAYVYAVALDSVSQTAAALEYLTEANEKWPNQYELLMTQVLYMEKLDLTEDILVPISGLSRLAPASPQVRRLLNQYIYKQNP